VAASWYRPVEAMQMDNIAKFMSRENVTEAEAWDFAIELATWNGRAKFDYEMAAAYQGTAFRGKHWKYQFELIRTIDLKYDHTLIKELPALKRHADYAYKDQCRYYQEVTGNRWSG
jgi:hypothetical protein